MRGLPLTISSEKSIKASQSKKDMPAQTATPFCMLCGVRCSHPDSFRIVDAQEIQQLLKKKCTPTAFHYAAALSHPASERRALCISCVSWKRRVSQGSAWRDRLRVKPLTPLDSVLMFCLAPGQFPEPDRRAIERQLKTAADPDNGYAWTIPEEIKCIIAKAKEEPAELAATTVIRTWWKANEKTSFFRHPATARAVRHTCVIRDTARQDKGRRWRK